MLGQKFVKFFRWYFGKFKKPKFYSEIIWPLSRCQNRNRCFVIWSEIATGDLKVFSVSFFAFSYLRCFRISYFKALIMRYWGIIRYLIPVSNYPFSHFQTYVSSYVQPLKKCRLSRFTMKPKPFWNRILILWDINLSYSKREYHIKSQFCRIVMPHLLR